MVVGSVTAVAAFVMEWQEMKDVFFYYLTRSVTVTFQFKLRSISGVTITVRLKIGMPGTFSRPPGVGGFHGILRRWPLDPASIHSTLTTYRQHEPASVTVSTPQLTLLGAYTLYQL